MRTLLISAFLSMLLTAAPCQAQFHPEARRIFNTHWQVHPEHPEETVRLWHDRLFHREIAPPLLARVVADLRRGIEAPVALASMLASPEFYVSVGSTADGFVRRTFLELVGRPPTDAEYRFWFERMHHADRAQVAHEMILRYPPNWAPGPAVPVEHYEYRPPIVSYRR